MTADPVLASVHIDAPPERVYEYFVKPQAMLAWMGDYALLETEPGGRFHLDIKGASVRGHYLDLEPPHRLVISWGYAGSNDLPPARPRSRSASPQTAGALGLTLSTAISSSRTVRHMSWAGFTT